MRMDAVRAIVTISATSWSRVERVVGGPGAAASFEGTSGLSAWRRKTVVHGEPFHGDALPPAFRSTLAASLENLRLCHERLPHPMGLAWSVDGTCFEIYTPWVAGQTLADAGPLHARVPGLLEDAAAWESALDFWAKTFLALSILHENRVLHGNLRPQNILLAEGLDASGPVPILLDGGYEHILQSHPVSFTEFEGAGMARSLRERMSWNGEDFQYAGTEHDARGADVASLALCMAHDLGLVTSAEHRRPLLWSGMSADTIHVGGTWLRRAVRSPRAEIFTRLCRLLSQASAPLKERRQCSARAVQLELGDLRDAVGRARARAGFALDKDLAPIAEPADFHKVAWVFTSCGVPREAADHVHAFLKTENTMRTWYVCVSAENTTERTLRALALGLRHCGEEALHVRFPTGDAQTPFASLDFLFARLAERVCIRNPLALFGAHGLFALARGQIAHVLHVLPSLRVLLEGHTGQEFIGAEPGPGIWAGHETLLLLIEKLFFHCLEHGGIDHVVTDALHRVDPSSFAALARFFQDVGRRRDVRWSIGLNLALSDETLTRAVDEARGADTVFLLSDDSLPNDWQITINALERDIALALGLLATFQSPLTFPLLNAFHAEVFESHARALGLPTDPRWLFNEALPRALDTGLLCECRSPTTGRLTGYEWRTARLQSACAEVLPAARRTQMSTDGALAIARLHTSGAMTLPAPRLVDAFMRTDVIQCAHAIFTVLVRSLESVPDLSACGVLKAHFLKFESALARPGRQAGDARRLLPRVRESLGDLCKMRGELTDAQAYYDAAAWDTHDPKRRAVLSLKAFMPSQIPSTEQRRAAFHGALELCEQSGLLPKAERVHMDVDPNLLVSHELRKLQGLLRGDSTLQGAKVAKLPLETLFALTLVDDARGDAAPAKARTNAAAGSTGAAGLPEDALGGRGFTEALPYAPRTRAIREMTLSQFLRTSLGWVESRDVFAHALNTLRLAVSMEDGTAIAHALFTLLLSTNRTLRTDLRVQALDAIAEVATRTQDGTALAETLVFKLFGALLFDGNLDEAKRTLRALEGNLEGLPLPVRACAQRLAQVFWLETRFHEQLEDLDALSARCEADADAQNVPRWDLLKALLSPNASEVRLERNADAHLVSGILLEQLEQFLLLTHQCIEVRDPAPAAQVARDASRFGVRRWLSDAGNHLAFVPESIARSWYSHSTQRHRFIEQGRRRASEGEPPQGQGINWSGDLALEASLTFDLAAVPNPETLNALATSAAQAGFFWLAARLARSAGSDLSKVISELAQAGHPVVRARLMPRRQEIRDGVGAGTSVGTSAGTSAGEDGASRLALGTAAGDVGADVNADAGAALNFLLEFAHNLQRAADAREGSDVSDKITDSDRQKLARWVLKAIPDWTDASTRTIAGSLTAFARRLEGQARGGAGASDPSQNDRRRTG